MNLERLKRRRLPVTAGDVFVLKPKGHDYYFGCVIAPDVQMLAWSGILVYLYNVHAPKWIPIPDLPIKNLLVPPLIVERGCWTTGIFENVGTRPLASVEQIPQYCFWSASRKVFVDEHGKTISRREPCGLYGLATVEGVDIEITNALEL